VIEIYPMEEGDERQTYELILRVFHEHVAPVYSKNGVAKFLGMLSPDGLNETSNGRNSFLILAKEQSKIIGMLSLINESHIALVFVDTEHQRKGVGKNLINEAIKKCLKRNSNLSAITVSASPNSRSFYEKMDFKAQGDEIDEDGMRFTPMQKRI
jgi:predicted GNAT family N-acyltransferase